eukprot:3941332-Rhodomonas_salina.2
MNYAGLQRHRIPISEIAEGNRPARGARLVQVCMTNRARTLKRHVPTQSPCDGDCPASGSTLANLPVFIVSGYRDRSAAT